MEARFGPDAVLLYHDVSDPAVRAEHGEVVDAIEANGYVYPVTTIDGVPTYDGAVSYPAILRAVHDRLAERVGGQ